MCWIRPVSKQTMIYDAGLAGAVVAVLSTGVQKLVVHTAPVGYSSVTVTDLARLRG